MFGLDVSLFSFYQVNLIQDREGMYDNDVDVIITLDDYKLSLMSRNAVCPGLSSLVELLVMSVSTINNPAQEPWLSEYLSGCDKEIYQFPLSSGMLHHFEYHWPLIVESILLEFGMMCIGVCDKEEKQVILNPSSLEIHNYADGDRQAFFDHFNIGILVSDSQMAGDPLLSAIHSARHAPSISTCIISHISPLCACMRVRVCVCVCVCVWVQ